MKNIVILTGAGMSAESGISTFRDSGGLWENYRIEDVATSEGFRQNPGMVLDFYNKRRCETLLVKPNQGHILLAQMEKEYNVYIVTQNVDNLHEKAGSSNVLHLHGELMKMRSSIDSNRIYDVDPLNPNIKLGDRCDDGSQLRPHIVWFGEPVPLMSEAERIVARADALVIIGTSLNVYPAAGLINCVSQKIPVYLIDPNEVVTQRKDIYFIKKRATEGVRELMILLNKQF